MGMSPKWNYLPKCPQHNEMAERLNRALMDRERAMLNQSILHYKSKLNTIFNLIRPLNVCFGFRPDIFHLRFFGEAGFPCIDKFKRSKLQQKSFYYLF